MLYEDKGFTLIELLVAISILAIVAVLGWRGLDGIVRSRDVLTVDLEKTRSLQLTFAQLQSDCSQNVNPLSYANMPEGRSSWIEPQRLILIRNEYVDDVAPSMQVVVYRIRNANLTRFESIPTRDLEVLKQLLAQARNPPDDQVEVVMQKSVQFIEFSGYSERLSTSGPEKPSPDALPNTPQNQQPQNQQPQSQQPANPADKKDTKTDGQDSTSGNQPVDSTQKVNQDSVTTGLQVSLQLEKSEKKIIKIFMLGGA